MVSISVEELALTYPVRITPPGKMPAQASPGAHRKLVSKSAEESDTLPLSTGSPSRSSRETGLAS